MTQASARTLFHIHSFGPGTDAGTWQAQVSIDPTHPIFTGHFPGRPVTPGVCMVQLTQLLVSRAMGRPMRLHGAKAIKFLSPLTPDTGTDMQLTLRMTGEEATGMSFDAQGTDGPRSIFSLKGVFGMAG